MFGGRSVDKSLAVWLGCLALTITATAQEPLRANPASSFAKARVHEINPPNTLGKFYFGIMGQVAKPGVYELTQPEPQLLDLIKHAGGLTQAATNRLRIVRQGNAGQGAFYHASLDYSLTPGDIVVADGPVLPRAPQRLSRIPDLPSEIQTADFVEPPSGNETSDWIPIALVGVLDRPVILPVPPSHANVPAVVACLGQNPGVASHVKVLPVGHRGTDSASGTQAASFICPTVLYFNPRHIVTEGLPKFPDVYRTEQPAPQTMPEEFKTADVSPLPSALPALPVPALMVPPIHSTPTDRRERSVPHSEVVLPAPLPTDPMEPPMISSLRKLEQQIPSPKPIKTKRTVKAAPPVPTPVTAAELRGDVPEPQATAKTSSWWPYLGLVLIVLAAAGVFAKLRSAKSSPGISKESLAAILADKPEPITVAELPHHQPKTISPNVALDDDVLTALVFNQLPIVEETPEPAPPAEKPASRKIFRLDPPEEEAQAAVKKPYIHARPQSNPAQDKPVPSEPKAKKPQEALGLLDRVLQRANERRAA